jgi:ABC-type dipeptide/oligopeptide/nickel transport system permease component
MQSWQKKFVPFAVATGISFSPPHSGHCFNTSIIPLIAIAPF